MHIITINKAGVEENKITEGTQKEGKPQDSIQTSVKSKIFEENTKPKSGATKTDLNAKITPLPVMHKKDFKKLPVWDFENVYQRDTRPRQTICEKSLRKSEDPQFKKAFIPNIQLFMHREHLNITEWNRLAHFNNPFGFMGYNYTEVKQAVDLIPNLRDYELLPVPTADKQGCIRCAVVATGGILNGSRMGKEIDSHDYVFRMNGAVIKGYEEDVGNKTSVYVHTAYSLVSSHYTLKKYGFNNILKDESIKYVLIPEGLRDFRFLEGLLQKKVVSKGEFQSHWPWQYYASQFDVKRFYVLHPDFLRYVRNSFLWSSTLEGPYWHIYRPTNGAFTMFLALHTCDIVDAYGFITADHPKYSNYYYERFRKTNVIFYGNHDYGLEIKTWKKLHDANIIRLYQREEETQKSGKRIQI
ncbi:alpha-N-acetylgalactosaminide alpha-2,6-sialyltransferase 1.1 [Megalops cyprinoides]|uniref:alpha-N-acetylgalactosaminide alpha-2,6-sialyltransferase 1.1 n=1 Tax=Megalops cyprinoides TaxID=118141 RepID=UPI001864FB54|nr:alpha-N-acetylgalactosaminide alpha-2,6-sialyltransferase 1.1 [Megalops cyprinoides]